jgi:hypothetical protein
MGNTLRVGGRPLLIMEPKDNTAELYKVDKGRKTVDITVHDKGVDRKHTIKVDRYGSEVAISGRMVVTKDPTPATINRLQRLNAYGIAGLHLARDPHPRKTQIQSHPDLSR